MKTDEVIDVAKTFSKTPFGRYRNDGEFSAQKFREEILIPHLESGKHFIIDFSKISLGIGSSFLEESFGGLVREGYKKDRILDQIEIKAKVSYYTEQIKEFLTTAEKEKAMKVLERT